MLNKMKYYLTISIIIHSFKYKLFLCLTKIFLMVQTKARSISHHDLLAGIVSVKQHPLSGMAEDEKDEELSVSDRKSIILFGRSLCPIYHCQVKNILSFNRF